MSVTDIQEIELIKARSIIDRLSWWSNLMGMWPLERTMWSNIKFTICITYQISHLLMSIANLITIFGDLELTVENLSEAAIHSILVVRIMVLKFSDKLRQLIKLTIDDMDIDNYNYSEEKKIYIKNYKFVHKYYSIHLLCGSMSTFSWFIPPLAEYSAARKSNETAILMNPFKTRSFLDMSKPSHGLYAYIYDIPMMFMSLLIVTPMAIQIVIIINICTQMDALSYRIRTSNNDVNSKSDNIFKKYIKKHYHLISMAQRLNDVYYFPQSYELLNLTVLFALFTYSMVLTFSNSDTIDLMLMIKFVLAGLAILILIFIICCLGEYVHNSVDRLRDSLYECPWNDMTIGNKKLLLVFMLAAARPLDVKAGDFYIYSFNSFMLILKSSFAYVSMLRQVS